MMAGLGIWGFAFVVAIYGMAIFGASLFVEWLVVKHVMDDPAKGLLVSVFGAFMVTFVYILASGSADSMILIISVCGLAFALLLSLPQYLRRKRANAGQDGVDESSENL
jgi:lipid-A-disaccharide synthase-like uncharacterized protein